MEVKQKIIDKEFQTLKKSFLTQREKIKIDFLKQNTTSNQMSFFVFVLLEDTEENY